MKKILFLMLLTLGLIPSVWAVTGSDVALFDQANNLYAQSKFEDAQRIYEDLSIKYPNEAVFFYNLGNTYHRLKQAGNAILAYERALLRDPRNADIRHNLKYVQGLLEYKVEDKRNWYIRAGDSALKYFKQNEVLLAAAISYFLFAFVWSLTLLTNKGVFWDWKGKALLILVIIVSLLAAAKNIQTQWIRPAVIVAQEAEIRYGPSEGNQVAFRLGEGLKVYVVEKRRDWYRVLLTNGEDGWVHGDSIALAATSSASEGEV